MGWQDSHPHQFIIRGAHYGPQDQDEMDWDVETEDEEDLLIGKIAKMGRKVRFTYEYDFGDSWQHEIVLEKTLEPEPKVKISPLRRRGEIVSTGGRGWRPGLRRLPATQSKKEWIGGKFDPERFSVDKLNRKLRRI